MKTLVSALSAAMLLACVVAGGTASAMTVRTPGYVAKPALVEVRQVKVCKTRTVKRYHTYWPHRAYFVRVTTCHWVRV
jgi:hypothetical protein